MIGHRRPGPNNALAISGPARGLLRAIVLPPQELRQLGDVGGDPRLHCGAFILQALQHQRETERDAEIDYVDAYSGLRNLRGDVPPSWIIAVIFRQSRYQNADVGERCERHHCRDDDPLR
jgi:hypothetical protein